MQDFDPRFARPSWALAGRNLTDPGDASPEPSLSRYLDNPTTHTLREALRRALNDARHSHNFPAAPDTPPQRPLQGALRQTPDASRDVSRDVSLNTAVDHTRGVGPHDLARDRPTPTALDASALDASVLDASVNQTLHRTLGEVSINRVTMSRGGKAHDRHLGEPRTAARHPRNFPNSRDISPAASLTHLPGQALGTPPHSTLQSTLRRTLDASRGNSADHTLVGALNDSALNDSAIGDSDGQALHRALSGVNANPVGMGGVGNAHEPSLARVLPSEALGRAAPWATNQAMGHAQAQAHPLGLPSGGAGGPTPDPHPHPDWTRAVAVAVALGVGALLVTYALLPTLEAAVG